MEGRKSKEKIDGRMKKRRGEELTPKTKKKSKREAPKVVSIKECQDIADFEVLDDDSDIIGKEITWIANPNRNAKVKKSRHPYPNSGPEDLSAVDFLKDVGATSGERNCRYIKVGPSLASIVIKNRVKVIWKKEDDNGDYNWKNGMINIIIDYIIFIFFIVGVLSFCPCLAVMPSNIYLNHRKRHCCLNKKIEEMYPGKVINIEKAWLGAERVPYAPIRILTTGSGVNHLGDKLGSYIEELGK